MYLYSSELQHYINSQKLLVFLKIDLIYELTNSHLTVSAPLAILYRAR